MMVQNVCFHDEIYVPCSDIVNDNKWEWKFVTHKSEVLRRLREQSRVFLLYVSTNLVKSFFYTLIYIDNNNNMVSHIITVSLLISLLLRGSPRLCTSLYDTALAQLPHIVCMCTLAIVRKIYYYFQLSNDAPVCLRCHLFIHASWMLTRIRSFLRWAGYVYLRFGPIVFADPLLEGFSLLRWVPQSMFVPPRCESEASYLWLLMLLSCLIFSVVHRTRMAFAACVTIGLILSSHSLI